MSAVRTLVEVLAGRQHTMPVRDNARAVHERMYVFDLHVDTPMVARALRYDLGKRHRSPRSFAPWRLHADLPRMRVGGLGGLLFGIVVNPRLRDPASSVERQIDFVHEKIAGRFPERVVVADAVDDFERARAQGKIAVWMTLEGAHELGGTLHRLPDWRARGVRTIGLAHFTSNDFAASSADKRPRLPGLSDKGRELVRTANRLGMVIDLAHAHKQSFYDAIAITQAPVIVSHTGVARELDVFRNVDDDQIRAVAQTGGVVGVMFAGLWLNQERWADVGDLLRHIDVVREVGGAGAMAMGSDFDGFIYSPRGLKDVADLPVLTQALLDHGYPEEELAKFWGRNVLRVFREVEDVGKRLRGEI